jgi:GTPase SAR1 family protein
VIGDSNVGKTSIISSFINKQFEDKINKTVGIEFYYKKIDLKDEYSSKIKIQI